MKQISTLAAVLALFVVAAPWAHADEADAVTIRNEIDAALDAPTEVLERDAGDMPLGPDLWPIGGRTQADGTPCPPPEPPICREDPWTCLDPCAPPDCCKSPFRLALVLGFSMSQGNSDKYDFSFAGEAAYDREPWLVRLRWLFAYGEDTGSVSTDSYNSDLRVERNMGTKWYLFASVDYNSDKLASLQYRWIGNVGAGLWVFRYKGTHLKAEAGIGSTIEKRQYRTETEALSGYLGAEYLYLFRSGIDFSARARYFPNFDIHDLSLIVLESSLAMPLNKTFAVALTLRIDHVIDAPDPAEDTDIVFIAGLQANF